MNTSFFKNKRICILGSCGTIGRELVRFLLATTELGELIGIDNNESELFFQEQRHFDDDRARFILGDVRDMNKLTRVTKGIDILFHTAAYKHVILCERSPMEAVRTNILGVQNVINAAMDNGVARVVFTSSDKAVNPTNVMGTSKLMGERLVSAANCNQLEGRTIFTSTRFGNVLGSRGSVVPVFREQIRRGLDITLTDPEMTRFVMSIDEAVRLVVDSATQARGGEVFVTKMPSIYIKDLAEVMIRILAPIYGRSPEEVRLAHIGSKPGEKMYEELLSQEEVRRTWELSKYYVVKPAIEAVYRNIAYDYPDIEAREIHAAYSSETEPKMSQDELEAFLRKSDLLEGDDPHPAERYWPDKA